MSASRFDRYADRRPQQPDPRTEAQERRYQSSQVTLGLGAPPRARRSAFNPKLSPAVLDLLPKRNDDWMKFVHAMKAEDVRIWVSLEKRYFVVEFASTPARWSALLPSGETEDQPAHKHHERVVFMTPAEAFALHQKHGLVDVTDNAGMMKFRFRRPVEPHGHIDAEPALRRLCGLQPMTRRRDAAA